MVEYRLLYFPIKGRAEPMRVMFAHAGVKFEDVTWDLQIEWPKHKAEMPFGQVPVLEYKGQKLAQTKAICRFLGKQLGLHPEDNWEAAQLDMLVDRREDIMGPVFMALAEQDPEKKQAKIKKEIEETFDPGAKFFDDWLAKSKSGYFGTKISWADFLLFGGFVAMGSMFGADIKKFPHIAAFIEKISNLPNVKKFNDQRADVPPIPPQFMRKK